MANKRDRDFEKNENRSVNKKRDFKRREKDSVRKRVEDWIEEGDIQEGL